MAQRPQPGTGIPLPQGTTPYVTPAKTPISTTATTVPTSTTPTTAMTTSTIPTASTMAPGSVSVQMPVSGPPAAKQAKAAFTAGMRGPGTSETSVTPSAILPMREPAPTQVQDVSVWVTQTVARELSISTNRTTLLCTHSLRHLHLF
eukprot:m.15773 g.15773  ORF g.15773 m.15773 type:complete len:147 (-) comp6746_c0_seq1:778-1218(-)